MKTYKGSEGKAIVMVYLFMFTTMASFWIFYNWMFK